MPSKILKTAQVRIKIEQGGTNSKLRIKVFSSSIYIRKFILATFFNLFHNTFSFLKLFAGREQATFTAFS